MAVWSFYKSSPKYISSASWTSSVELKQHSWDGDERHCPARKGLAWTFKVSNHLWYTMAFVHIRSASGGVYYQWTVQWYEIWIQEWHRRSSGYLLHPGLFGAFLLMCTLNSVGLTHSHRCVTEFAGGYFIVKLILCSYYYHVIRNYGWSDGIGMFSTFQGWVWEVCTILGHC